MMLGLVAAAGVGAASPAAAIDCGKATNLGEKRICGSQSLRSADAAMSGAYTKLLHSAPDPEIRSMLVDSQRRWIAARDRWLSLHPHGPEVSVGLLRRAIEQRAEQLGDRTDKGFVAQAEAQRRFLAKYSEGTFSGFDASCDFVPDDVDQKSFSYECETVMHVRNEDRICSAATEWASGSVYEYYAVSRIEGNVVLPVATCGDQSGGICDKDQDGHSASGWSFVPENNRRVPAPRKGLPQLDAEGLWPLEANDVNWFGRCLTSPVYPRQSEASSTNGANGVRP